MGPIGVFDSGVGGLTVLRALRAELPDEDYLYLGDTARLPYGTKSADTVSHYALQIADRLVAQNIRLLVVACNTASAHALPALRARWPDLPIFGVIDAAAREAVAMSPSGRIAVLATEGTIATGAFPASVACVSRQAKVNGLGCNLLVGLAEEGWCEGPEAEAVVARYLRQLGGVSFDTLILGCTHFPLLAKAIAKCCPTDTVLVECGNAVSHEVGKFLTERGDKVKGHGSCRFQVTDSPERFGRLAKTFLAQERNIEDIQLISL